MSSGGYSGGFGQQPSFGGGFGGGFGQPQPPQYGGYGVPQQPQYGGFQQPQYGGGFNDQFGGGRFRRGFQQPGNAYAQPFPQMQPTAYPIQAGRQVPQPMPSQFPFANPSTGVMPSEPLPDPNAPSAQILPALPEPQTGGGYPARDQFSYSQAVQPTVLYDSSMGLGNMLGSGLGGMYGGYSPMPYGGYQPMGGYRMFQF